MDYIIVSLINMEYIISDSIREDLFIINIKEIITFVSWIDINYRESWDDRIFTIQSIFDRLYHGIIYIHIDLLETVYSIQNNLYVSMIFIMIIFNIIVI